MEGDWRVIDASAVGAHHQVELHCLKPQPPGCLQGVLAETTADPLAAAVLGHHIAGIGHMGAGGIDRHHHRLALLDPCHLGLGLPDG